MAVDKASNIVGVARLHKDTDEECQIRYMAVDENYRGQGIGRLLLEELHLRAKKLGVKCIVLNARENARGFYEKYGYSCIGGAHTLFGVIPHYKMRYYLNAGKIQTKL